MSRAPRPAGIKPCGLPACSNASHTFAAIAGGIGYSVYDSRSTKRAEAASSDLLKGTLTEEVAKGGAAPLYVDQVIRFLNEGGSEPPPRLADLIAHRIIEQVDQHGIQRLVIDSATELQRAIERAFQIALRRLPPGPITIDADGLLSRILQHEVDHLDGILFVDRVSALKRKLLLKRWQKVKPD